MTKLSLLLLFAMLSSPISSIAIDCATVDGGESLIFDQRCSYTMTRSTYAHIKVYYLHEQPEGLRYVYTSSPELLQARTHYIHAQGHPVAFEWHVEGRLVKTCGEIPDPVSSLIFSDGFESGDLGRWRK